MVLLWDAVTGEQKVVLNHIGDGIRFLYSPDGIIIATRSAKEVRLWDAVTGEQKATLTHDRSDIDFVYSPNGRTIATGSYTEVKLWDANTGKHNTTLTDTRHRHNFRSPSYSPDGCTIATGGGHLSDGTVRLWDVETGEQKATLTHAGDDIDFVYSPDGCTIATGGGSHSDGTVRLWDVETGKQKATLTHDRNDISFVYSPDGCTIATTNRFEAWLWLWDADTAKCKTILTENFSKLVYSSDGDTIATVSVTRDGSRYCIPDPNGDTIAWVNFIGKPAYGADGSTIATVSYIVEAEIYKGYRGVCLWDARTGKLKATLTHNGNVASFVYSPDSKTIATGAEHFSDGIVRLWDAVTGEHKATLTEHARGFSRLAYSPNGHTIATQTVLSIDSTYKSDVWLWDAVTGEHKTTLTYAEDVVSFVYSPDSKTIATQAGFWFNGTYKQVVCLWDAATGKYTTMLTGHAHGFWSLAYSPDGTTIATINDKRVYLSDVVTGERKNIFMESDSLESDSKLVYSPDGSTIATGDKHFVQLWDVVTGELKTALTKHNSPVESLAYSQGGKTIVIESGKGLQLWDVVTGELKTALAKHNRSANSFAYSPDGKKIVIGNDSGLRLWDAATGEHKATLTEYDDGFSNLAYSPDGNTIAAQKVFSVDYSTYKISEPRDVCLWDAATGEYKTTLTHTGDFVSFEYNPDGKTIATGSKDGTVLLWEVPSSIYQNSDINPREIHGNWRAGWTLDVHTLSSRPLPGGTYDTKRTEFGELVFQLKYRHNRTKIQPIAEVAAKFVQEKFAVDGYSILPYLKAILPIPPSDTSRTFQPVTEIAQEIGNLLSVPVRTDYLTKIKQTMLLKNLPDVESKREQLRGAFVVQSQDLKDQCVLLIDDLYDSGTTLTEVTRVLYEQGAVRHVLVLALTRTRRGGN